MIRTDGMRLHQAPVPSTRGGASPLRLPEPAPADLFLGPVAPGREVASVGEMTALTAAANGWWPTYLFVGLLAGDGLRNMGYYQEAREVYRQGGERGSAACGDRLRLLGDSSAAREAYQAAARRGSAEAGEGLYNMGDSSAAREAWMDAARAGNAWAGDSLRARGFSSEAEEAWRLAAASTETWLADAYTSALARAVRNGHAVHAADALHAQGEYQQAREIYLAAAANGSVTAGDRQRAHGDWSESREAYRAAGRAGNPEAGDRLRALGALDEARQAYLDASQAGILYVPN
jgi:tetratricopeptide (TPR) repeat protein